MCFRIGLIIDADCVALVAWYSPDRYTNMMLYVQWWADGQSPLWNPNLRIKFDSGIWTRPQTFSTCTVYALTRWTRYFFKQIMDSIPIQTINFGWDAGHHAALGADDQVRPKYDSNSSRDVLLFFLAVCILISRLWKNENQLAKMSWGSLREKKRFFEIKDTIAVRGTCRCRHAHALFRDVCSSCSCRSRLFLT